MTERMAYTTNSALLVPMTRYAPALAAEVADLQMDGRRYGVYSCGVIGCTVGLYSLCRSYLRVRDLLRASNTSSARVIYGMVLLYQSHAATRSNCVSIYCSHPAWYDNVSTTIRLPPPLFVPMQRHTSSPHSHSPSHPVSAAYPFHDTLSIHSGGQLSSSS